MSNPATLPLAFVSILFLDLAVFFLLPELFDSFGAIWLFLAFLYFFRFNQKLQDVAETRSDALIQIKISEYDLSQHKVRTSILMAVKSLKMSIAEPSVAKQIENFDIEGDSAKEKLRLEKLLEEAKTNIHYNDNKINKLTRLFYIYEIIIIALFTMQSEFGEIAVRAYEGR